MFYAVTPRNVCGARPWLERAQRPRALGPAPIVKRMRHVTFASSEEPSAAAAEPTPAAITSEPVVDSVPETVYYEGSGSPAELVVSLLLGATVLYLPLTLASVGKRLWVKTKFTNRRIVVTTDSPVFKREIQVSYDQIKEVRVVERAFGLWGDMVVFLKDGSRLEILGIEKVLEIRDYIYKHLT